MNAWRQIVDFPDTEGKLNECSDKYNQKAYPKGIAFVDYDCSVGVFEILPKDVVWLRSSYDWDVFVFYSEAAFV